MRIEKLIHDYYEQSIMEVEIPPIPEITHTPSGRQPLRLITRIALAAVLLLSFVPFAYYADKPPELARRTAEISREYEIEQRITSGVVKLRIIVENSSISGGK